jgi:hypothetical protein
MDTCHAEPTGVNATSAETATTSERVVGDKACAHKDRGYKANQSATQHWLFSLPDNRRSSRQPAASETSAFKTNGASNLCLMPHRAR